MGSNYRTARLEHALQICSPVLHAGHRRRSCIHRRSRGQFLRARRAHRRQALEFSNRSRPSRLGDFIFSEWQAIHRGNQRLASECRWWSGRPAVPAGKLSAGLHISCICFAGGIEMKALFVLLFVPALAGAQNLPDVLKQGEDVFNKSCAAGYCHGALGAGGGAPRVAARGFDQTFINDTVTRGIPNTAMPPFANTLSRSELTAVVAYVARLNGIANPSINPGSSRDSLPETSGPPLSAGSARGRELFSDAIRSFGRCSR